MQKDLVVVQVESLGDSAQQSGAGKNLELRIEIRWVLGGTVEVDRVSFDRADGRIVCGLQIHLDSRQRFVYVWLPAHINRGQASDEDDDPNDQPDMFANRTPVFVQAVVSAARLCLVGIIPVISKG